jgi:outer membrane lipoprotein-sorting protein
MKYLRTVSTRRLLASIAGLLAAVVAGSAIAVAASGSGPVPKPKPLAQAIHDALAAPKVAGISARISFTNHLIDASNLQGSDPVLTGATGRLWLSGHQLRLELQSDNGDAQVVVSGGSFWISDPSANTVYEGKLPADHSPGADKRPGGAIPSIAQIQSDINRLAGHVNLSGAVPTDVAGQPTYTVRVSPKHDGGLLGSGELAWDAVKGVPLRIAVYARGDSTPVLELKATDITYGAVSTSNFAISPPSGAKVVKVSTPTDPHASSARSAAAKGPAKDRRHRQLQGAAAVAKHLPFSLVAPTQLVGLPRRSVTLLDWAGKPAALVTYGQNLGGIAVIEQTPDSSGAGGSASAAGGQRSGPDRQGLKLPTVSINGASAQELDTALGTVVRFTRDGVAYTVLGSVPPAAADLAARAL